jgi:hypothetical protein
MTRFLPALLTALLLCACASLPTPQSRHQTADMLARAHGWREVTLPAGQFDLTAYLPSGPPQSPLLTVYMEGDGLAWISASLPSDDPTPVSPMALRLALAQPQAQAAYLARPCQYGGIAGPRCSPAYWTHARFSPEVVVATNLAIDALKQRFGARQLALVGYSGGGAVAALAAARRTDVIRLVTIAGNLDHRAWTAWHRVSPLEGSLNPADEIGALDGIPQWHFVGSRDATMPPLLARRYASRHAPGHQPAVIEIDGFDHSCCWDAQWPQLWQRTQARE